MSTIKRLYNSNSKERKQRRSSSTSPPSPRGRFNATRLHPLPAVPPLSPSPSSFSSSSSRPQIPQKLFINQALLLLLAILLIPLADAVKGSTESSVDSRYNFNETTSMTQTESVRIQRVTISPSYTSTNLRTGSGIPSAINDSNNNINHHKNNSHTITPVRRNFSFSYSTSSSSSVSPVIKNNTNNVHPRHKTNKISNKMYTVHNYNAKVAPVKTPRRRPQPHQFVNRPRQTLFSADYQPQLMNSAFNQYQNPFVESTTTVKPTMHPLRVLQTEISPPVKMTVVLPQETRIITSTANSVQVPATFPIVNSTREDNAMGSDINLVNHRMNGNNQVPKVVVTPISIINETEEVNNYENHLNDEIRAQLDLINQRAPPPPNNNDNTEKEKQHQMVASPGSQVDLKRPGGLVNPVKGAVEGRSASEVMEPLKRKPIKQQRASLLKANSTEEITESKQLKSAPANYFDQFNDNIAEEDHQYEVTEIVNQYPAQHDTLEQHKDKDSPYNPSVDHSSDYASQSQNQNQQQDQVSQLQTPLEIPTQNPNHNYLNQNMNNFYKSEKNRPKLNSYYDQNYYAADASNQHQQLQQPQYPINNHYHYENQKHQAYKEHYYANSDKGDYNGNPNEEVAHSSPSFGPHGQSQHPQPPFSNHHHSSPFGPSGNSNSHFFNSHPPPQPYRGEHDIETSEAGNIMDRFEVFYTEHKILTWGAFFIAGSLALVCVVAYLYINHPPTEVVTARSFINEYLRDPGLLKFLSNLVEPEIANGNRTKDEKRRRRRKRISDHLSNFQSLLFQQAKEL